MDQEVDLVVWNAITQSSPTRPPETVGKNRAAMEKTGFSGCEGAQCSAQLSLLLSPPQTTMVLKAEGTEAPISSEVITQH